jgi:hypothetical protein
MGLLSRCSRPWKPVAKALSISRKRASRLAVEILETRIVPASFAAGDLAVLQAAASANNTTASILELSPSAANQSTPVQTINISGTGASAIRISGSAATTGYVADSGNGSFLMFTGANSTDTSSNVNTLNPRAVVAVDNSANVTLPTTYTGISGNQTRGASTLDDSSWFIGDQGGIYTNGGSGPTLSGNFRSVRAFGGILYAFTASSTSPPVGKLTTLSGSSFTPLPGLPNGTTSAQDFYLIQSGSSGSTFDVLYVLSATSATAGTLAKYSLVSGSWAANGSYTTSFGGFGLAAANSGSGAFLYVTTGTGSTTANKVMKLSDTAGFNATISINAANNLTLYTSATGTILKGLAFAPVSAPTVTTPTSMSITTTSATLGGNVTSTGGPAITERGVVYAKTSDNASPRIGGSGVTKVIVSGTTGVFSTNVTALLPGTSYSFAAYASNSVGTGYTTVGTFSTNTLTNHAPVLSGANNLTTISGTIDSASNTGSLVSDLIAGQVSDADSGASTGIAITAADNSNGLWQYSRNGGASWTPVPAVSNSSAYLLPADATTKVRFVPSVNVNGTHGLTFRAWDQTSGSAGGFADTSTNGGSTAFSSATVTSFITVNAIDQPPVNTVPGPQVVLQGTSRVFSTVQGNAISISDPDAGTNPMLVTLTATGGTMTLSGTSGLTFTIGDGTADSNMTFTGTITNINAALNGMSFTPAAGYWGSAILQILTNDQGYTGSGGPLTDSDTVPITIVPAVLLNELKVNPPGSAPGGDKYQYVELRGPAGAALTNIYFVEVNGNASSYGVADFVVNLSAAYLGSNGLLLIKSPTSGHTAAPGTTVVTNAQFDNTGGALNKHTASFYLVYSASPIVQATDYDSNDDGALDGALANALTLDNVGWSDGATGAKVYGGVALTQSSGTPDAATRFLTSSSASTAATWYNGDLYDVSNDPTTLLYDATRHSANMPLIPSTPSLTPGNFNFDEPPVVTTTASPFFYLVGGPVTAIDSGITVADADNALLQSATVTISSGYVSGQDVLSFTNTASITGSFSASTGTLTLTGPDTVADYQTALRSITYTNTSSTPNTAPRTVSFVASDGTVTSAAATRTITVLNAPIISEFLASNSSGITDAAGDNTDWIEIYNPSSAPLDLYNWSLTDKSTKLDEWQFPHVMLNGHAFLVVFADGQNVTIGSELHTSFSLSHSGEFLALVDPNGVIASQYAPTFPPQITDVSYGVKFDTATLIAPGASAQTLIPTNDLLGTTWTSPSFTPTGWTSGTTGVGFGVVQPVFNVTYVKSNRSLDTLDVAEEVAADPAEQTSTTQTTASVINYLGTGGAGHFTGDSPYPTQAIGTDIQWFLIEASAQIVIPTPGAYTFDVNSDDGFVLELSLDGVTFSSQYTGIRGASDTLATFNFPEAGNWDLSLLQFNNQGSSSAELSATQGTYTTFTAGAFHLVGDTASGGLAAFSVPTFGSPIVIGTNTGAAMQNQYTSAFVRIPFTIANPSAYTALDLGIQYDDGFVAYLNGVQVASRNAPATLAYNATATTSRTTAAVFAPEHIDLSVYLPLLQTGSNVLAIQGLNSSLVDGSFLVLPTLTASAVHPDQVGYFADPTPGTFNSTLSTGLVAQVSASVAAGFYTNPITVTLTTTTTGAVIRYTTDGSAPTLTNGVVYTGPITISSTTTLRAQAFLTGYLSLPSSTWTYLFLNDVIYQSPHDAAGYPTLGAAPAGWPATWGNNVVVYGMDQTVVNTYGADQVKAALLALPTIALSTDLGNLFDPTTGIYANAVNDGRDWERPTSIEWINPDGSPGFQVNAGLRIRGGYSRSTNNPKHAFRIFFRSDYGAASLTYPIFGNDPTATTTFQKFDLRCAENYSWSFDGSANNTMIQDGFYRASQLALGAPSTHSRWVNLYIDGQYWGVYQIEERPEQDFAATYLGGSSKNWDVVKVDVPTYTIYATNGSLGAYQQLWQYVLTHDMSSNANYYFLQGKNANGVDNPSIPNSDVLLDVDNLIDYMMLIYQSGNLDAPISNFLSNKGVNNFFALRDETGRRGFIYVQHDSEHTLLNDNANRTGPFNAGGPNDFLHFNPQYLSQVLMANADYRQRFADLIQKSFFGNGPMTVVNMQARYQVDVNTLSTAIIGESARWGDSKRPTNPFTKTDWLNAVNFQENDFLVNRNPIFLTQMKSFGLASLVSAPTFLVNGTPQNSGNITDGSLLTFSAPGGGVVYFTTDGSDPRLPGGGISPYARSYTPGQANPALILNSSMQFAARTLNGTNWSAISTAVLSDAVPAAAGNLAITELQYDPAADPNATMPPFDNNDNYEFIELRNIGNKTIDLTGVKFTNGVTFDFTTGDVRFLAPGQSVVVVSNLQAFDARYDTTYMLVAGEYSGNLSNGGEQVTLVDATATTIKNFTYGTTAPWPTSPHGGGPSLTVINVNGNYNDPTNWRASTLGTGTPGYSEGVDTAPQSAPTGFQAMLSSSINPVAISNQLTWNTLANASSYLIERKLGAGGTYVQVGVTTGTSYLDMGLAVNTNYVYRVRGVNILGTGPYSAEISVTTPTIPSAPTAAQLTSLTATSISLRWTDNANNEDGFQIYRASGGSAFTLLTAVAPNPIAAPSQVTYTDSGLTPGTTYQYQIVAYNIAGSSVKALPPLAR